MPAGRTDNFAGTSNIRITQQYAKVTENLVSESTKQLHEKFTTKETKSNQSNIASYENPFGDSFVYHLKSN